MANLYFCQPSGGGRGMLRAVLTRDDCQSLVHIDSATYVGEQFPALNGESRDFALLLVGKEEADAHWRCGFYRLNTDLMELNAKLLKLAR
jgi:hypothetical protein